MLRISIGYTKVLQRRSSVYQVHLTSRLLGVLQQRMPLLCRSLPSYVHHGNLVRRLMPGVSRTGCWVVVTCQWHASPCCNCVWYRGMSCVTLISVTGCWLSVWYSHVCSSPNRKSEWSELNWTADKSIRSSSITVFGQCLLSCVLHVSILIITRYQAQTKICQKGTHTFICFTYHNGMFHPKNCIGLLQKGACLHANHWVSKTGSLAVVSLCIWQSANFMPFFRYIHNICEKRIFVSFVMSVHLSAYPHGTTLLPLDGFWWNVIF